MSPLAIIVIIGVVAFAAIVGLVYYIGKGSEHGDRTAWMAIGLALSGLAAFVMLNLVSIYYVVPTWAIIGLALFTVATVVLFVFIGRDVGWRAGKMISAIGLLLSLGVCFAAVAMSGLGGDDWVQPLYRMRVAQIAEEYGFVPLMPADLNLITDMMPVEQLEPPDEGLHLMYEEFVMEERNASEPVAMASLEALVAPGARPVRGFDIPSRTSATRLKVQGQPAVAVEYASSLKGEGGTELLSASVLVFALDGVEVRMLSAGGERESGGEWVPYSKLTVEELAAIAQTLEPVE